MQELCQLDKSSLRFEIMLCLSFVSLYACFSQAEVAAAAAKAKQDAEASLAESKQKSENNDASSTDATGDKLLPEDSFTMELKTQDSAPDSVRMQPSQPESKPTVTTVTTSKGPTSTSLAADAIKSATTSQVTLTATESRLETSKQVSNIKSEPTRWADVESESDSEPERESSSDVKDFSTTATAQIGDHEVEEKVRKSNALTLQLRQQTISKVAKAIASSLPSDPHQYRDLSSLLSNMFHALDKYPNGATDGELAKYPLATPDVIRRLGSTYPSRYQLVAFAMNFPDLFSIRYTSPERIVIAGEPRM